jgi:hypothetical protein
VGNEYSDKCNVQSIVAKHLSLGFSRDSRVLRPRAVSAAQDVMKHWEAACAELNRVGVH